MKITETPRDAMQGIAEFIPSHIKAGYLNSLLKVGFDVIDFGSFVSPKAIPQLSDTAQVVKMLDLSETLTKLLSIVGNVKGAVTASAFPEITYLGYPFSSSPTFLRLNINSTIEEALANIDVINNLCEKTGKQLVVYYSLVFGNPYGDTHSYEITESYVYRLHSMGIRNISLADTLGAGDCNSISEVFSNLKNKFTDIDFGLHLHLAGNNALNVIDCAYKAGCSSFDSAILGKGGCPMSAKKMIGNLNTQTLIDYIFQKGISSGINLSRFNESVNLARKIFHKP